jgi:hypothetical protein
MEMDVEDVGLAQMSLIPLCRLSNRRDIAPNCPLPSPPRARVGYVLSHHPRAMGRRGSAAGAGGHFYLHEGAATLGEGMAWVRCWSDVKHETCGRGKEVKAAILQRPYSSGSSYVHIKGASSAKAFQGLEHIHRWISSFGEQSWACSLAIHVTSRNIPWMLCRPDLAGPWNHAPLKIAWVE